MLTQDLIDLPIEVFGGYTPALAPTVCPPGASPLAQDCDFPEGAVTTRGGLLAVFGPGNGIPGAATINGLKTYLTPQIQRRLMAWDNTGNLYKESPDGTLTQVAARPQGSSTLYQASTLFGREYSAYYAYASPLLGLDIPRQYDDTNWDRVSQVGPGQAPSVIDLSVTANLQASPNGLRPLTYNIVASPFGLSEIGHIVTVNLSTTPNALELQVGDPIKISGAGVGGYNGTFTISAILSPIVIQYVNPISGLAASGNGVLTSSSYAVAFTAPVPAQMGLTGQSVTIAGAGIAGYNATWIVRGSATFYGGSVFVIFIPSLFLAASGNGTVVVAGHIGAGLHQVSVAFITRQGYITMPAVPPTTWTAAGNLSAAISGIPIGPFNIIARLLIFTPVITPPATTGTFYSLPNGSSQILNSTMLISDNTTTTVTVDFNDTILIAGFNAQYLFTQIELGECASVNGYNSRLAWCGERNKVINVVNLTFDGGWNIGAGPGGSDIPMGWTANATGTSPSGGGSRNAGPGAFVDWGDSYRITGDGASVNRGEIDMNVAFDWLGVPILSINTSYSVRIRLRTDGTAVQGRAIVDIYSPTVGLYGQLLVDATAMSSTQFTEYSGIIMVAQPSLPNDIILRYRTGNTLTNGSFIIADNIEIYPTLQPYNFSTARFSHSFNPESYDGTTGAIQIRPNDGQMLHASFPLRNNLYFGKDHYLCYVTDDGVNEPSSWPVNELSATVGICGPNAVDWTEEWAVFAERSGLYIFWGSDPIKITPEVQQDASNTGKITWNSINWAQSQCIWVRIDKVNKQILVGVPIGNVTLPNYVFMLDYKWLEGAADIAGSPMVTYSAFTGKVLAHGRGRRWMVWNISAASMTFAERANGTVQPFYGNSVGNGKVYQQLPASVQASDDGVAINSFYSSYYAPSHVEEQMVQLGAHQKLLGYLKWRATGSGILAISIITARRVTLLRGYILSLTPTGDGERGIEVAGERFSIQVGTNAVGSWFSLEELIPSMKKHPTMVVRGANV